MRGPVSVAIASALIVTAAGSTAAAQSDLSSIDLVVDAGRPLRVELDQRIRLQAVGPVVTGTVREPVYAYDRIVIPVGTRVHGHVSAIDGGSTFVRARAQTARRIADRMQRLALRRPHVLHLVEHTIDGMLSDKKTRRRPRED